MKCVCGRFVTQQARVVAKIYKVEGDRCIHCLADSLNVPYQELIDRYMGIYDCRDCSKNRKKEELRRRLLGLG